ncbi:hypothetical protein [Clostridium tyrobutyricum]|uniref:hypothetical protein n=1 Tax=Clostridium tyrobutyricum TaxID=1519 RepID=UPI001C380FD9|nr:hypothetical protein [Clostridium tyrobutyricum]MBV4424555.1 hypothetical protein [Clostridium tyrobutyricum]
MMKKGKTATNNQWTSTPAKTPEESGAAHRKKKTATDNQWTSTLKNNIDEDNN